MLVTCRPRHRHSLGLLSPGPGLGITASFPITFSWRDCCCWFKYSFSSLRSISSRGRATEFYVDTSIPIIPQWQFEFNHINSAKCISFQRYLKCKIVFRTKCKQKSFYSARWHLNVRHYLLMSVTRTQYTRYCLCCDFPVVVFKSNFLP